MSALVSLSKIARKTFWMIERVLILDAGDSATLMLIAERIGGEVHLRHWLSIPTELGSEQCISENMAQLKSRFAPLEIVLIIPQSESVSQRICLKDQSIEDFVLRESQRFEELEGKPPLVDYQCLGECPDPTYWLTYCQPDIVEQRLRRLGLALHEVDEVTSAAQGFWGFFETIHSAKQSAYVVDVGREHSSMMAIEKGKPVFASSFAADLQEQKKPLCSASLENWFRRFQNAPSKLHGIPNRNPELPSHKDFVLLGEESLLPLIKAILKTKLGKDIHFHSHAKHLDQSNRSKHFDQSSHSKHFDQSNRLNRSNRSPKESFVPNQFGVAFGVARAALGASSFRISLLPKEHRTRRDRRRGWARLRAWTPLFATITLLCLLIAIAQKWSLLRFKETLLADTQEAMGRMIQTEQTLSEFALRYEQVRPILRFQQETIELIQTLRALRESHHPDFWLVLLADGKSYATRGLASNKSDESSLQIITPNTLIEHSGFVAEFCFSTEGEAMRKQLRRLVNQLEASGLYKKVDTLAEDVRRPLAKSEVVVSDRHIALWLQFHRNYFQHKLRGFEETSPKKEIPASTFEHRNTQP